MSQAVSRRLNGASPRKARWFGVAFGVLLGLAAVCHGCHVGDHDDELSAQGSPRVEQGKNQELRPASGGRQPPDGAKKSGG